MQLNIKEYIKELNQLKKHFETTKYKKDSLEAYSEITYKTAVDLFSSYKFRDAFKIINSYFNNNQFASSNFIDLNHDHRIVINKSNLIIKKFSDDWESKGSYLFDYMIIQEKDFELIKSKVSQYEYDFILISDDISKQLIQAHHKHDQALEEVRDATQDFNQAEVKLSNAFNQVKFILSQFDYKYTYIQLEEIRTLLDDIQNLLNADDNFNPFIKSDEQPKAKRIT